MKNITIIMYHYVREIKNSKYPAIKGLEISSFKRQLDFLEKNFEIIQPIDLIQNKELPNNSCLLSFDDGFKDHTEFVLPELNKRKLKGCFFPPGAAIIENEILDVHSIHFILAKVKDKSILVSILNSLCLENGYNKKDLKNYWNIHGKIDQYDSREVVYFKRMLQFVLPLDLRKKITNFLFKKYLNISTSEFAKKLYMNKNDLNKLLESEMYIGSHSYNHYWLNTLNYQNQKKDIEKSLNFLKEIGAPIKNWIMCYPYGSFDDNTISILKEKNCSYAFTTIPGIANLDKDRFKLPRKDTNDFPQ
jgi:peptidoglycan/xylan/chitin deacetylase (PgdA/CDA1 family)